MDQVPSYQQEWTYASGMVTIADQQGHPNAELNIFHQRLRGKAPIA